MARWLISCLVIGRSWVRVLFGPSMSNGKWYWLHLC
jgi:hypothetical protein